MRLNKNYRTSFLRIIFFLLFLYSRAQSFTPDIENYSIETYKADNQNWDIDVDDNGVVFIANNRGLLVYNGQSWQLHELPNKTIVRSVLCVNDRIYTGSYEEFGFWKKDDFGNYHYTSLIQLFNGGYKFDNEQVWQIVKYKDKIIFKSFARGLYIYNGESISYVENSFGSFDISVYGEKLLIANTYRGLESLSKGRLEPFEFSGNSNNVPLIKNIATQNNLLFVYNEEVGGFIYDAKELVPLSNEVNTYLNKHILNKVTFISNNRLALGTIKDGIIVYDLKTKTIQKLNKDYGLINNTVLGLEFHEENLWVALDNGLGKVDFKTPFIYYKDFTGKLGTVYDAVFFNETYYLASNTGVYKLSKGKELSLIKGSEGQVWDLTILSDQLIAGHNEGSFLIENGVWSKKLADIGVFCSIEVPQKRHWFLQGTYYGINLLMKEGNDWKFNEIENIPFLVNNIIFESERVIWVTHPYKGVFKLLLDKDYTKALKIIPYGNNQNFKQYQTNIYAIDGNIIFYNSGKWFKYFKENDSIGAFKKFKKFKNEVLISKEKQGVWFNNRKNNTLTFVNNQYHELFNINLAGVRRGLVTKYEKIIIKNDSLRMINLNDGFAMFNINTLKNKEESISRPCIDKMYSKKRQFLVDNNSIISIPFNEANSLSFDVFLPKVYGVDLNYVLTGTINQEGVIKEGKLVLQNLSYGNYTLTLKSQYINDTSGLESILNFKVLPPWYLSNTMKLLYVLSLILLIYSYHKINKIKVKRQQIEAQRAYIRENQKKIQEIEKQNLEKDILNKKRELVNSTETIIKKNETIILLRNELDRLLCVSPSKNRTKKLIDLSKNKKDADKDWRIFEASFNELHEDFFKRLINQYPKLTGKDLKLSAYIKTGLATKGIAPLMGITTRGVEIHRYRLRKKLNLDSNNSLSNFLVTF